MYNEITIEVLNSLIEINNDRIEGYKTASNETEQADLKSLFKTFEEVSRNCKAELLDEITKLKGTEIDGTTTSGKVFRLWMDLKAAITGNNRKAILNACEFGEEAAQETYNDALENTEEVLSENLKVKIASQKSLLRGNLNIVKGLIAIQI